MHTTGTVKSAQVAKTQRKTRQAGLLNGLGAIYIYIYIYIHMYVQRRCAQIRHLAIFKTKSGVFMHSLVEHGDE